MPPVFIFLQKNQPAFVFAGDRADFRFVQHHAGGGQGVGFGGGVRTAPTTRDCATPGGLRRCADRECAGLLPPARSRLARRFSASIGCWRIVFPEAAGPAGQVSAGALPARMLLPPATSRNAGQLHSRSTSAMRSSAKPLPMAPRSNSSLPRSQRTEKFIRSSDQSGRGGLRLQRRRRGGKRAARGVLHLFAPAPGRQTPASVTRKVFAGRRAGRVGQCRCWRGSGSGSDLQFVRATANAACAVCAA
jgi:hypothetical protein